MGLCGDRIEQHSFNPTLVRLRRGGAIWGGSPIDRFNPTLVRLRLDSAIRLTLADTGFQSHAGSIEASPLGLFRIVADPRFNPTLVRLRRGPHGAGQAGGPEFQSHAGSIEAIMGSKRYLADVAVSIPRWFD